jgi:hypothetical protein
MAGDPYPDLGFDPCPGDLGGYQAAAQFAGRSAGSQDWRGAAADAFRGHVVAAIFC